jgi:hypothetical protein
MPPFPLGEQTMWKLALAVIMVATVCTVVGCDDRGANAGSATTSTQSSQQNGQENVSTKDTAVAPVSAIEVSKDKTVAYWRAVYHSPNISLVFTDPNIVLFTDDSEIDQFQTYITVLRSRAAALSNLPTAGVHADLMEWNLKACLLLELQAMAMQKYDAFFKHYVNPLGGGALAADSLLEFLQRTANGESPSSAAAKSLLSTALTGVNDIGNAYDAVYKVTQEVVREKYEVRARVSNQLGVDLPLDDDGCPIVRLVFPGSPAAYAGIIPGDVCSAYDGKSLATESFSVDTFKAARDAAIGKTFVVLTFERNGEEKEVHVPPGLIGLEYDVSPTNTPAPWDVRYFTQPKGWTDPYPYEKQRQSPWKQ